MATEEEVVHHPCENCPWRTANQGKRTPWGFFTKKNLTRLWNQVRRGGLPQSCHPTDPRHPDHVAAGAKEDSTPQECPGSVILVWHELLKLNDIVPEGVEMTPEHLDTYYKQNPKGLTKNGILYWLIQRYQMGGVPIMGGPKLPEVDREEPGVALPDYLCGAK